MVDTFCTLCNIGQEEGLAVPLSLAWGGPCRSSGPDLGWALPFLWVLDMGTFIMAVLTSINTFTQDFICK